MFDHSHPDLEQRIARLESTVTSSTVILLEVRDIARGLRGHLVTIDEHFDSVEERLGRIEEAIRRIAPNGQANP